MRAIVCGILALSFFRCRDVQPFGTTSPIQGYQINGIVTSANGIPIDSVDVILDYYVQPQAVPLDTDRVFLADSTQLLDIAVYTPQNTRVRELYHGTHAAGLLPRTYWDGLDDGGNSMPSGKYFIRYTISNEIAKQVPTLVYLHSTTMTANGGQFTISNDRLPIGDIFDIFDASGTYVETVQIVPDIILVLKKLSLGQSYDVTLVKDQITTRTFILQ